MNDYLLDDFDDYDYDWETFENELQEELRQDTHFRKLSNIMDFKTFNRFDDKRKIEYLYNIIYDIYSYLLTIQDVAIKEVK